MPGHLSPGEAGLWEAATLTRAGACQHQRVPPAPWRKLLALLCSASLWPCPPTRPETTSSAQAVAWPGPCEGGATRCRGLRTPGLRPRGIAVTRWSASPHLAPRCRACECWESGRATCLPARQRGSFPLSHRTGFPCLRDTAFWRVSAAPCGVPQGGRGGLAQTTERDRGVQARRHTCMTVNTYFATRSVMLSKRGEAGLLQSAERDTKL